MGKAHHDSDPTRLTNRLEFSYAEAVPELSLPWQAQQVPAPALVILNDRLAGELGIDPQWLRGPAGLGLLTGQVPDLATVAQAYAGHQFGSYAPRLGDGRALLLGEIVDPSGRRHDLHLKGSGRTPFARGGDGQAVLGPMLREYLISEAMHALGVPTTRALAVVATGRQVWRESPQPGAVLCRVAASHLRVGTFQYAAAGDRRVLRALADYAIQRHYPELADTPEPYLALVRGVVRAQARLIARWMTIGFVHGVMNTDNMTISGETIDYGPCAFMDAFDPRTVFSSIDHGGRYGYGNQPVVAQWNLARFAETLLPLIADDPRAAVEPVTEALREFGDHYNAAMLAGIGAKLGLPEPDQELIEEILGLLHADRVDYTRFFRALAAGTAAELFTDTARFGAWALKRERLLSPDRADLRQRMDALNQAYIPRNHVVEAALGQATEGDLAPFHRVLDAVSQPYRVRPGFDDLLGPDPTGGVGFRTYCGT